MKFLKKYKSNKPESTKGNSYYTPLVDIYENEDGINLYFDIPGADKNKIDVKVEKDVLSLTAEVIDNQPKKHNLLIREFNSGGYSRSFSIPDYIDSNNISAKYNDGVLELILPKVEEVKPKQIEVKIS